MRSRRLLALTFLAFPFLSQAATVLVLQFHNSSRYDNLNWVGESISETVRTELGSAGEIVLGRDSRAEGLRRLGLRPDAEFTKASLIKLGQALDVDYVCYGTYDVVPATGDTQMRNSSVQISARFLDLRRLHAGPQMAEAGKLADLSRLNEHLAWQTLHYIEPSADVPLEKFLDSRKFVRLDAEESYMRGLLAPRGEQQEKWFTQAAIIDPHQSGPPFELGKINLEKKKYRQALDWFARVQPQDTRYSAARFRMGLAAYSSADYTGASNYFREVAKAVPLNEVFNNLGAAELQMGQSSALEDFRKAVDGDSNDTAYHFNLGVALLKVGSFEEARKALQFVVDRNEDDNEARNLLERAGRHEGNASTRPPAPPRLKINFDETAFRQLKAMLQPKNS